MIALAHEIVDNLLESMFSPEEIAALKTRFEYGSSKDLCKYVKMRMYDDPRAKGRETSYEYLTSEDVQFWNMLADEYDAKNPGR